MTPRAVRWRREPNRQLPTGPLVTPNRAARRAFLPAHSSVILTNHASWSACARRLPRIYHGNQRSTTEPDRNDYGTKWERNSLPGFLVSFTARNGIRLAATVWNLGHEVSDQSVGNTLQQQNRFLDSLKRECLDRILKNGWADCRIVTTGKPQSKQTQQERCGTRAVSF